MSDYCAEFMSTCFEFLLTKWRSSLSASTWMAIASNAGQQTAIQDRIFRADRARKGNARSRRKPTSSFEKRLARQPARLEVAGYTAPTNGISGRRSRANSRGRRLDGEFNYRGAVDRDESFSSCAGSMCCRCPRPMTSRKVCFCSKRWPAVYRLFSRDAARSSKS